MRKAKGKKMTKKTKMNKEPLGLLRFKKWFDLAKKPLRRWDGQTWQNFLACFGARVENMFETAIAPVEDLPRVKYFLALTIGQLWLEREKNKTEGRLPLAYCYFTGCNCNRCAFENRNKSGERRCELCGMPTDNLAKAIREYDKLFSNKKRT